MQSILDDHYKKSDLKKFASERKNLTEEEREMIHILFSKYKLLLGGTLGTRNTKPLDI